MNAERDNNPYTPPAASLEVDLSATRPPHGWKIEGARLLVQEGAELPPVDLSTGRLGSPAMVLRQIEVEPRQWWRGWLRAVGFTCVLVAAAVPENYATGELTGMMIICGFAALMVPKLTTFKKTSVSFHGLEAPYRAKWILHWVVYLTLVGFLFAGIWGKLPWEPGRSWLLVILPSFLDYSRPSRLRCHRKTGMYYEIRGVHPEALEHLGKIAAASPIPRSRWN